MTENIFNFPTPPTFQAKPNQHHLRLIIALVIIVLVLALIAWLGIIWQRENSVPLTTIDQTPSSSTVTRALSPIEQAAANLHGPDVGITQKEIVDTAKTLQKRTISAADIQKAASQLKGN
ncbi:MAG: hypothetical protein NTZ38_02565 [Candidatus Taylorbacteria bacterium]|nr:hypothetical protein [Candidatus Taylorbacteria bacterium]